MSDRQELVDQIIEHEGLRLKVYMDTLGVPTIGYGRNLRDKGITSAEAMLLLDHDLDEVVADCATFPWFSGLDAVRQRVIVDMRFQLGPAGLRRFKRTLEAIAGGFYGEAAAHMRVSLWAKQTPTRANRLAGMMETGQDTRRHINEAAQRVEEARAANDRPDSL